MTPCLVLLRTNVPKVGFEPDICPYKHREVANYHGGRAQFDAVQASPEGEAFPAGITNFTAHRLDQPALAMKIAAERDKDTLDIARLLRQLNITNATDAVNLACDKYGEHSIPLAATRDNYLIVVDDAFDAEPSL